VPRLRKDLWYAEIPDKDLDDARYVSMVFHKRPDGRRLKPTGHPYHDQQGAKRPGRSSANSTFFNSMSLTTILASTALATSTSEPTG
jgi:hypothetical protein